MRIDRHGGGCCGVQHLVNMSVYGGTKDRYKDQVMRFVNRPRRKVSAVCTEVVVTRGQLRQIFRDTGTTLEELLEECGFVFVRGWKNINSGNECFMYLHTGIDNVLPPSKRGEDK